MARLADPGASRAVLVGVSSYTDGQQWPALPAIETNLADLQDVLTDKEIWGLPPKHCTSLLDPADPGVVLEAIAHAAAEAADTLVVYYAGHGSTTAAGLMLTLASTTRSNLLWRSVQFGAVRQVVHERRALNALIVLDCCYSGLAHAMTDLRAFLTSQITTTSAFMLTSSARDAISLAPHGERNTAFTGELLRVLRTGSAYSSRLLTLGEIARSVTDGLLLRGMPEPRFSQTGSGDELAIARNRHHELSSESSNGQRTVREATGLPAKTPEAVPVSRKPQPRTEFSTTMGSTAALEWTAKAPPVTKPGRQGRLASWLRGSLLRSAASLVDLEAVVVNALQRYLGWQRDDGGWPSEPAGSVSNAWSTAQAVYLLNELDADAHQERVDRAVAWLLKRQHPDGGWGLEPDISDVTGTELVIYALAPYREFEVQTQLQRGANWLIDKQNPDDSGWAFVPRNTVSSVYCTTWGMISLRALAIATSNPIYYKVHVQRGKKFLIDAQSRQRSDPGWGKFLGSPTEGMRTAHALNGLFAAGAVRSAAFQRGLQALSREQLKDGGWGDDAGSNLEGTCWAIVALVRTGRFLYSGTIARGIGFCLDTREHAADGWPEHPGGPVQVWCTHHAILALSSFLNAFRPLYQAPLLHLFWWRLKGQILMPMLIFKARTAAAVTVAAFLIIGLLYFGSQL